MSCGRCPDSASSILSDPQPSLGLRDLDAQEVAGALSSVPDGTSGAHSRLCLVGRRVAEEMATPPGVLLHGWWLCLSPALAEQRAHH